jgi:two-component system, LytTR family, sensor kinase
MSTERMVPGPILGSWPRSIALGACFWTAVGLVAVLPEMTVSHDFGKATLLSLVQWWSWGLLAPAIVAVDTRLPFSSRQPVRRILVHLAVAPAFGLVDGYLSACIAALLGVLKWPQVAESLVLTTALREMFWSVVVYGLIVGVRQAYLYQQRYLSAELRMERLERSFSAARLNSLRMQLDPHFLFNALNTISAQVEREPRLARRMIEHLGELLRLSLSSQGKSVLLLAQELVFLDHYLAIQKIRFGSSLRVEINVAAEVTRALVPGMFIQPLVENAIRHGLAPRAGGGTLTLSAERVGDELHVRVCDDGVGLPADWSSQSPVGLGLSITRERISGLYPDGSTHFSICPRATGGTEVEIHFPLRLAEEAHDLRAA